MIAACSASSRLRAALPVGAGEHRLCHSGNCGTEEGGRPSYRVAANLPTFDMDQVRLFNSNLYRRVSTKVRLKFDYCAHVRKLKSISRHLAEEACNI